MMSKKSDNDFCQFCRKDEFAREMFVAADMRILILEEELELLILQKDELVDVKFTDVPIKYCPMCGRKLGDKMEESKTDVESGFIIRYS